MYIINNNNNKSFAILQSFFLFYFIYFFYFFIFFMCLFFFIYLFIYFILFIYLFIFFFAKNLQNSLACKKSCVQKCKLLAIVCPGPLVLLALVVRYRIPGHETIRYHLAVLNATKKLDIRLQNLTILYPNMYAEGQTAAFIVLFKVTGWTL